MSSTALHPALASPRSSTSSVSTTTTAALGPLTPGLESEDATVKMVNPDDGGAVALEASEEDSEAVVDASPSPGAVGKAAATPRRPARTAAEPPSTQFAAFSFGGPPSGGASQGNVPIAPPRPSPTRALNDFSFGTCPADFTATPTAEMGQFEYPLNPFSAAGQGYDDPSHGGSGRSSLSRAVPLGESHRRGSIIARPSHSRSSSSGNSLSPPPTRRSSTASSIATVPAAGRRPSILHSASASVAQASLTPISLLHDPNAPAGAAAAPLNPASRRNSILFQPKTLPSPVPPSLLARRGSLPAAQLFGLPPDQHITLPANLALFPTAQPNRKGSISTYPTGGHTTSTHALYHRRESAFSEASTSGASSGSSQRTIREAEGGLGRRASLRVTSGSGSPGDAGGYDHGARRASMPHMPNMDMPRDGPLFTGRLPSPATATSPRMAAYASPRASVAFIGTALGAGDEHGGGGGGGAMADQRRRRSSARHSGLGGSAGAGGGALSSSEESTEEAEASDGLADLPTPELDTGHGFVNPWSASAGGGGAMRAETEQEAAEGEDGAAADEQER